MKFPANPYTMFRYIDQKYDIQKERIQKTDGKRVGSYGGNTLDFSIQKGEKTLKLMGMSKKTSKLMGMSKKTSELM